MTRFIRFRRSMETITISEPKPEHTGNAFLPPVALVSLNQDSSAEIRPIVIEGNRVREGQLIARGVQPDCTRIHAPIPGFLRSFKNIQGPDGASSLAAEIVLSGSFDILGRKEENYQWKTAPESEIIRIIEDKGVVSTFDEPEPLVHLIRAAKKHKKTIIVVRMFDLDPTCQLDSFLAEKFFVQVVEGAGLIAHSINTKEILFIHDDKKEDAFKESKFKELLGTIDPIVVKTDNRYPSGNRKQLILAMDEQFKKRNMVFIDPSTALSAYEAVVKNKPVLYRHVFVSGPALSRAAVLKVRIGTPVANLIMECGGFSTNPSRIVINGLITGTSVLDLSTPITKTTKSIHIMDKETCPEYNVYSCIRCGRCLQVCPMYLDPMELVEAVKNDQITKQIAKGIDACQHCGCCTMVCPSRIPLHHILSDAQITGKTGALQ